MPEMIRDLRQSLRSLARSPAFSGVAVFTLALGIGATTAIFTLLDGVVLRPLPYPDSERLVAVKHPVPGLNTDWVWDLSEAGFHHYRKNARSLADMGLYTVSRMNFTSESGARRATVAQASAGLLRVLGARPAVGRLILRGDNRPDAPPVAVLAHDFWRSEFGGDRSVVGRSIRIEGTGVEVVGVSEPGFELPDRDVDVWLAIELDPGARAVNAHYLTTVARLAGGVTRERAEVELRRLTERFPDHFPGAYSPGFMEESRFGVRIVSLREEVVGTADRLLSILLAAVGLVLLIACANVANLFLVRLESRRRETAVREAMGAGRGRLAWHVLSETLSVAVLGGALGVGLAWAAVRIVKAWGPDELPRLSAVTLDHRAILFALGLALVTGLLFGAGALFRRRDVDRAALHEGSRRTTPSRTRNRVRQGLVAGQVALALVLLVAGGLMVRTFVNLRSVDPGFDTASVLTAKLNLPSAGYPSYDATTAFYREFLSRIEGLPGVERAAMTTSLPLAGRPACAGLFLEGHTGGGGQPPCVGKVLVSPGYFRAMGIPVRGRIPDWTDVETGSGAVVVTRALGDRLWPGEDPIGKGIRPNGPAGPDESYFRVVGVTGEIRTAGLDEPPVERIFFPVEPIEGTSLWSPPRQAALVVQTAREESGATLVGALRKEVSAVGPDVAVSNPRTMVRVLRDSTADTAFSMSLLLLAAGMAVVLSAVGLYGVIAYTVTQRRGEIGIRMAMGAQAREITGLVVRQSLALTAAGIVAGLAGAIGTTRFLDSILFEVEPTDPWVLGTVSAAILVVALAASWIPARRAAGVDPARSLRAE